MSSTAPSRCTVCHIVSLQACMRSQNPMHSLCSNSSVYIAGRAANKPLPAAREARSASICWRKEPCRSPGSPAQEEGFILVDLGSQQQESSCHCSTPINTAPRLAIATISWCDVPAEASELQHGSGAAHKHLCLSLKPFDFQLWTACVIEVHANNRL